ncbi:hypothetical protein [Magnetovibrio sp.]|uniref:hypothetical protein n=1 Tax=Magnetovibrio sp. TaxID=2024836 RepID=UPI002F94949F
MTISNARFSNEAHTQIAADIDGVEVSIPAIDGNRHYEAIKAQAITPTAYVGPALAEVQADAKRTIDAQAEAARLSYITPGDGQAMSYREKSDQARECLAAHTPASPPAPGVYVLLDSEVGIMKNADTTITADAYEVAVVVEATRQAWLAVEATINRTRVQAKADIAAATTEAEIDAVLAALVWV